MRKQVSLITVLSLIMGIFLLSINGCTDDNEEFQINGQVIDTGSKQGLRGVEISVDNHIPSDEPMITGQGGRYTINFTIGKANSDFKMEKKDGAYNVTIPQIKGKEQLLLKFKKEGYEDVSESVLLSPQTLNKGMTPKDIPITVSVYKEGEASGPAQNRKRTGFSFLNVFYAPDEKGFDKWRHPTNEDGKLELSVPGVTQVIKIKVKDNPNDEWIPLEMEKTVDLKPGSHPEVTFIFREARKRTINITCVDDKTNQAVSKVSVKINKTIRTNISGVASQDVLALPNKTVKISCTHSEYYAKSATITIKEGQDTYPQTIRLDPKIYVTVTVTDATYPIKEPVPEVYVYANKRKIGPTNSAGKISNKVVKGFSSGSSITIHGERWEITGAPQISPPEPKEKPHEYQVDVQVRFVPQTVKIITLDKKSKEKITVNEAVLLDRNYKPIASSQPTISQRGSACPNYSFQPKG